MVSIPVQHHIITYTFLIYVIPIDVGSKILLQWLLRDSIIELAMNQF